MKQKLMCILLAFQIHDSDFSSFLSGGFQNKQAFRPTLHRLAPEVGAGLAIRTSEEDRSREIPKAESGL